MLKKEKLKKDTSYLYDPLITVENVGVILNGKSVLNDISFNIHKGDAVGIIGPNGAGKTTLLRALLGLIPVSEGSILVMGENATRLGKKRNNIGYLPQRPAFERRFPVSVKDVVSMGLLPLHIPACFQKVSETDEQVFAVLQDVNMDSFINRPFQELSGGEQQRVLLARALVHRPSLLFLDEPGTGLDYPARQNFMLLLERLQEKRGLTVLLVSHDLAGIATYTHSLICINRTMHIHGNSTEVLRSPRLQEAYRCQFDLLLVNEGETFPVNSAHRHPEGDPYD